MASVLDAGTFGAMREDSPRTTVCEDRRSQEDAVNPIHRSALGSIKTLEGLRTS
jgi:hypothetical protein